MLDHSTGVDPLMIRCIVEFGEEEEMSWDHLTREGPPTSHSAILSVMDLFAKAIRGVFEDD